MSDFLEYIKNNWIAIAAFIVSFLSWITSFSVRRDSNKLKLAEKRNDFRILLGETRVDNLYMIEKLQHIKKLQEEVIEHLKQIISKNPNAPKISELEEAYQIVTDQYSSTLRNINAISTVTEQLEILNKEVLDRNKIKTASDITELTGRLNEKLIGVASTKQGIDKYYESAQTIYKATMELP